METEYEKNPIHGNIYQLKLLMLFLYRGVKHEYDFCIRTETEEAGKFDDIVFQYKENGQTYFRLLQAKHKLDGRNKITAQNLLNCTNKRDDYSLKKYFYSFMKSKNESMFKKGCFKDLIICTNIDFNYDDLRKNVIDIFEINVDDNILDVKYQTGDSNQKIPKRYKFQKSFVNTLKQTLEEGYSDAPVVNILIDHVLSGKQLPTKSFSGYENVLLDEVIDDSQNIKTFKENFIGNYQLSCRAEKFRELVDKAIERKTNKNFNLNTLNEALKSGGKFNDKTLKIIIPRDFRKDDNGSWPLNNILLSDVEEFLDLLVFAVNQPDEEKLGEAIKNEIGNQFNDITTEHIYKDLFHHMLDFFQGKSRNKTSSKDRFHSYNDGKSFIDSTRKKILYLQLSGFRDLLDSIAISFHQLDEPQNFISSKKNLWLLTSNTPWLSSLFIYQWIVKILVGENKRNNFIHVFNWSDLLENGERLLLDFENSEKFVIIISCLQMIGSKTIAAKLAEIIYATLSTSSDGSKRVIIISLKEHELTEQLKLKFQSFYNEKLKIKFSDIDGKYQAELLKKKYIIFQKNQKVCVEELFGTNRQGDMLILDAAAIEILLRNSEVNILEDFRQVPDFNCITYNVYKSLSFNQVRETIRLNESDIFIFFGDEYRIKSFLLELRREPLKFNTSTTLDKVISHRFVLLDPDKESHEFNQLCQMVCEDSSSDGMKPILHKLKFVGNDQCIWVKTFDHSIYVGRYLIPNNTNVGIFKTLFTGSSDFAIFSGVNKCRLLECFNESRFNMENLTEFQEKCDIVLSHKKAKRKFNLYKNMLEENEHYIPIDRYSEVRKLMNITAVHWIKVSIGENMLSNHMNPNLKLVWMMSFGNFNESSLLHEYRLAELNQKIILISNKPGTGKSSSMTFISQYLKREKPQAIIIKIDLNQHQNILTSCTVKKRQQLVKLLFRILNKSSPNPLAQMIMKHKLEFPEQVILLFDGFDEVTTTNQEPVLELLSFIYRKTKASMWITTRPNFEQLLERTFCINSYTFMDFLEEDRIRFLNRLRKTSIAFSGIVHQNFSSRNLAKSTLIWNDLKIRESYSSSVTTPLMLRMLVGKHIVDLTSIPQNENEWMENLSVDTYKLFVRYTYKNYFFEKIKIVEWFDINSQTILGDAYTEAYGRVAVKLICHNYELNKKIVNFFGKEKISVCLLMRIGLIQNLDRPGRETFVHPSFIHYFATEYICKNLKTNPDKEVLWDVLLGVILDYRLSREMFDEKLKRDEDLFKLSSKKPSKNIMFNLLKGQIEDFGIPVVFIRAADSGLKRTMSFLCNCAENSEKLEIVLNLPKRTLQPFPAAHQYDEFGISELVESYYRKRIFRSAGRRLVEIQSQNFRAFRNFM